MCNAHSAVHNLQSAKCRGMFFSVNAIYGVPSVQCTVGRALTVRGARCAERRVCTAQCITCVVCSVRSGAVGNVHTLCSVQREVCTVWWTMCTVNDVQSICGPMGSVERTLRRVCTALCVKCTVCVVCGARALD